MAKAGRKRKPSIHRERNGRAQRLSAAVRSEKIMGTVMEQRLRAGATDKNYRDHRWGFALGRLRLQHRITDRQYQAGEIYTRRAVAYYGVVIGSLPAFPSSLANMLGGIGRLGSEKESDEVGAIRDRFAEMEGALADAGLLTSGGQALTRLCIMDREPEDDTALGIIRASLDAIAHKMRLPVDDSSKSVYVGN